MISPKSLSQEISVELHHQLFFRGQFSCDLSDLFYEHAKIGKPCTQVFNEHSILNTPVLVNEHIAKSGER